MVDTMVKTDRDRFYERLPGGPDGRISMTFDALFRGRNEETIVEALKAVAQMYFDEYTDATRLPDEFWRFAELCSDMTYGLGLDIDEFDRDNWDDTDA